LVDGSHDFGCGKRLGATIAWSLVDLTWGGTAMIGGLIAMLYMNWKLALITLAVVPFSRCYKHLLSKENISVPIEL
jgi:ABC-type bacteriocin/lantibiotic exporter with double-glycine peptidase domain